MADDPWADPAPALHAGPTPAPPRDPSRLFDDGLDAWGSADDEAPAASSTAAADSTLAVTDDAAPAVGQLSSASSARGDAELDEFASAAPSPTTEAAQLPDAPAADGFDAGAGGADDDFDDFGDVAGPSSGAVNGDADDDFGDFGDFDEGAPAFVEQEAAPLPAAQPPADASLTPLQVTSASTASDLAAQIRSILSPPIPSEQGSAYPYHDGAAAALGTERIREGHTVRSGRNQAMFDMLTVVPKLRPVDYQRSTTRRSHLIALGVPINLEEFAAPSSRARALPPLALTLDNGRPAAGPSSAPAGGQLGGPGAGKGPGESSLATPRSASPASGLKRERMAAHRREELGLGPAPQLDVARAEELVALTEDQLTLQSLPYLRSVQAELNALTESASLLLTHHLTLRESHAADSEMYNGLIRDLVAGAASRLAGAGSGRDRRHTSMSAQRKSSVRRPASAAPQSGRNSPALAEASPRR